MINGYYTYLIAEIPDSIPIYEFMQNETYGRVPISQSRSPFTCGVTGRSYTTDQCIERSIHIARAFSHRLGWLPNEGSPWNKVTCIFSLNSVSRKRSAEVLLNVGYADNRTSRSTTLQLYTAYTDYLALLPRQMLCTLWRSWHISSRVQALSHSSRVHPCSIQHFVQQRLLIFQKPTSF